MWDEVEAAYRWWVGHDKPDHTRFGLTVTAEGQRAWLDDPARSWAVRGGRSVSGPAPDDP
ncbi:hypothetical protein [Streptomyces sp. NBC_01485]|uniref:hypothetical protein n=1 Tax=Streptomyces sp. NBC_01485 TaxID=2903884 RepID=UPI003FCCEBCE